MFNEKNVLIVDKKVKKAELFKMFAKLGKELGVVEDADKTLEAILDREKMGTTGFTHGFAIPHCLDDNVKTPTILVAKIKNPIDWGAEDGQHTLDGQKITVAFCLLITKNGGTIHLEFLKKIARALMREEFRNSILKSETVAQISKEVNKLLNEN